MDIETDTNPIDRSIAHLLFHRPKDPAEGAKFTEFRSIVSFLALPDASIVLIVCHITQAKLDIVQTKILNFRGLLSLWCLGNWLVRKKSLE